MPRSRPRLPILGAIVLVVLQLAALYWPAVTVQGPVSWTDKIVHLLVFAVPTFAVGWAWGRIWPAALIFAAHAPVSEVVQQFFLPGRSGDVWDAVVDIVGVCLGVVALLLVRRRAKHW